MKTNVVFQFRGISMKNVWVRFGDEKNWENVKQSYLEWKWKKS